MNKKLKIPQISRQLYEQDVLNILIDQYSNIGSVWTMSQLEWMNSVYRTFNDHDKFLTIIYLIKNTLDFYSRNFTMLNYNQFYSKDSLEIEKFNIAEISTNLSIPKESARRKIVELEKKGVIKRNNKKIIIDRSSYPHIKPMNSIKRVGQFLSILSELLYQQKTLSKKIETKSLEKIIHENFSYVWKLYYEIQIPMMIGYKGIFGDLEAFHIWGLCVVNQHTFLQKKNKKKERLKFIKDLTSINNVPGLNAMSISDISGIPRATVVRKLKKLLKKNYLRIDDKKHYRLTDTPMNKVKLVQDIVLKRLAKFSTKIFNLIIL
jgi:predicted transcriptional regulator